MIQNICKANFGSTYLQLSPFLSLYNQNVFNTKIAICKSTTFSKIN